MKLSLARSSVVLTWFASAAFAAASGCSASPPPSSDEAIASSRSALAASNNPPGGLAPSQVPQFVAVTFDDNFSVEGMNWATSFFRPLKNPVGSGNPSTFDGTPARSTFPSNSTYLSGMQAAWETGVTDGHEFANHTVNHGDGLGYSTTQWSNEITECTSALVNGLSTPGNPLHITGFRSPYLHYNDNLFTVLVNNSFAYDSSIMGCWADGQTAKSCSWPYTMDTGSPDADVIASKFAGRNVVSVGAHPIWELPVAVVFVPDDSLAATYGFPAGLRQRVANAVAGEGNPNFFEQSTGKYVGMDISLLLDAKMTRAEAFATLKYSLDQRLAGNRSPMVIVNHTHVYASAWDGNAPGAQATADRRGIVEDFVSYALSKPEVRVRPLADVLAWMKNPSPLGACKPTTCASQGRTCGTTADGCGATLTCGSCGSGQTCNAAGACQTCTPTTCAAQGATCGSLADGCGGTLACGSCASGQTCSASHTCQSTSCQPTVASYAAGKCNATATYNGTLYKCVSQAVGVNGETAGCGTAGVYCSSIAPDNGAWGSTAWQAVTSCGTSCTPTTCAAQGKSCGSIADGCGGTLSCGTCGSGQTCSSANTCVASCTPTTCAAQGKSCGSIADGCGGTLSCGTCGSGQTCSSANTCVASCTPTTCAAQGKNCGSIADGCGGTLSCGTCGSGKTCSANVCQVVGGNCSPTIASYSLGKCGATASYNGKLYQCISQAAGVNGETTGCGTTGVYCGSIAPDNAAWGTTAWSLVPGCN